MEESLSMATPKKGFTLGRPTLGTLRGGTLASAAKASAPPAAPAKTKRRKVVGEPSELEVGSHEELRDLKADFEMKRAREQERFAFATDAGFWRGLVFATSEDAMRFEQYVEGVPAVDEWLDGYEVCRKLGIPIKAPTFKKPIVNILEHWAKRALALVPPPEPAEPPESV